MKYPFSFLLGVSLIMSSCQNEQTLNKAEAFPVTSPLIIDTNTYTDYVAEIYAVQNIELRAQAQGYLEKVHVDEGANVRQGQLLFSINNREYSEGLAKSKALRKLAQAEETNAELELANTRILMEKNIISKIEFEFAKNKLQAARARVEEAKANEAHAQQMLSYTEIRAPFSGVVSRIPQKTGSLVEAGTLLTSLSQNDEVFAYFDISEREYLDFMSTIISKKPAQRKVKLILANSQAHKETGIIETMDGEIDERTGNLAVRARFGNAEHLLKHGASGKIRIDKALHKAMIIPQKSTVEIQDRIFVYKLDKNNKVKMQQVEVQTRIPHFYILSKGLTVKDRIVYEGLQSVKAGSSIRPEKISMKKILRDLSGQ